MAELHSSSDQLAFDVAIEKRAPVKAAPQTFVSIDGRTLVPVPGRDGLLHDESGAVYRIVHPHSRKKAKKVYFYADIVTRSMAHSAWPSIWWVELHSGPARLFEEETREILPGSPLDSLSVPNPYSGYVFVEYDSLCAASLRAATKGFRNVQVIEGDANSADVHDRIRSIVPTNALVVFYADPEDLDDFTLSTVEFFAPRYRHGDWLINFPVGGVVRYLTAGNEERAVQLLGHPHPQDLVKHCEGRTWGPQISLFFQRQLEALGYECHFEPIFLDVKQVRLYDLFIATKDTSGRALDFFDKACGIKASGQRTFDFAAEM